MKKLRRKNQIVLTALALMIAAAGYMSSLNKQEKTVPVAENQDKNVLWDISDEDVKDENIALEQAGYTEQSSQAETEKIAGLTEESTIAASEGTEESTSGSTESIADTEESVSESTKTEENDKENVGEAVQTFNQKESDVIAEAKLQREAVRTRNEETLNNVINNKNLSDTQRKQAADNILLMTENANKEASIEAILKSRGISSTMVTINSNGVEVLIGKESITDSERAQIEDTVKRETKVGVTDIVISLMNQVNTSVVEEPD